MDRALNKDSTVREHAYSVYRQTKKWPEDIPEEPPRPEHVIYLLDWFEQMSRGRGSSGFGPNPLSWSDLDAWCRLMGVQLERWELKALRLLDLAYLSTVAAATKAKTK